MKQLCAREKKSALIIQSNCTVIHKRGEKKRLPAQRYYSLFHKQICTFNFLLVYIIDVWNCIVETITISFYSI